MRVLFLAYQVREDDTLDITYDGALGGRRVITVAGRRARSWAATPIARLIADGVVRRGGRQARCGINVHYRRYFSLPTIGLGNQETRFEIDEEDLRALLADLQRLAAKQSWRLGYPFGGAAIYARASAGRPLVSGDEPPQDHGRPLARASCS